MELSEADGKSVLQSEHTQLVGGENLHPAVRGAARLSMARQVGVIVGLAVAVAIGVAAALWSQTPNYALLYASVSNQEAGELLDALDQLGVDYKVESSNGAILVPQNAVHEVRMKLSAQGLPKSTNAGFELLDKDSGFGMSQSQETIRYQRALEGEIARSIMVVQSVKSVRVHLALPKQTIFLRKRKKSSASVILNLYSGRFLEKGQVEAIVHLVASSVPELESQQVTVIDQRGNLLSSNQDNDRMSFSNKQFEYKTQFEEHLINRVENILIPLVGGDAIRTQITVDMDFTTTERTYEQYNPDLPALRSEQVQEEQSKLSATQGVPGALSNQPPAAGSAPEEAAGEGQGAEAQPQNSSRNTVRNYELDKTITHSRLSAGNLRRLAVAVVIDNAQVVGDGGTVSPKPYSQEEMTRFTELVKQAVGFDVARGDQVTVTNAAFFQPELVEPLPEIPIWEQLWFHTLAKNVIALLAVLALVFGLFRPMMNALIGREKLEIQIREEREKAATEKNAVKALPPGSEGTEEEGQMGLESDPELLLLEAPQGHEMRLEFAQNMVDKDPKRVAQVVKNWVKESE